MVSGLRYLVLNNAGNRERPRPHQGMEMMKMKVVTHVSLPLDVLQKVMELAEMVLTVELL